jgi:YD repeat-containing protein
MVMYRFDTGANVETVGPAPAGNTYGTKTKRTYDAVRRLVRDSVYVNTAEHAYTRYEYPTNGVQSKVYSTIVDTDADGADADDEVLSETFFDGAGRVRMARSPQAFNTNGTTATWAGTLTEYDMLGRVARQSVPTEVDSSWSPTGDDATRGWLWTYQKYDWKDRVVRKINTDGADSTTLNGSDVLISYDGCGCAGGQVTNIVGELVPRSDGSGSARRKQKIYEDILGRTWKTVTMKWDGATPYSSVEQYFNGRNQIIKTKQIDHTSVNSPQDFQEATVTFDGHGRIATSHRPEQRDASDNLKYAVYTYNQDDTVATMTDARGVVTTYTYNSGRQIAQIAYVAPSNSSIPATNSVSFSYDNLGNRTQMIDGMGSVSYQYDSLSRLIAETRSFSDTLPYAPLSGNGFRLEYDYDLFGGLKSYKDPYGQQFDFSKDRIGRISGVGGATSFGGITNYASNAQYRAWGALKHIVAGSGYQTDLTYDIRQQVSTFIVDNPNDSAPAIFNKGYEYYSDGRLSLSDENVAFQDKFDKSFNYDHAGRVVGGKSGLEAHNQTETDLTKLPYRQTYFYDAFGNTLTRESTLWDYQEDWDFHYTITNNRVQYFQYDDDGRLTSNNAASFAHDAAGRLVATARSMRYETTISPDGDGHEIRRSQRTWNSTQNSWGTWEARYLIFSSVLGTPISEAGGDGKKKRTYVMAGGEIVARQGLDDSGQEAVGWVHRDPSGLAARTSWSAGVPHVSEAAMSEELDALENNVGLHASYSSPDRSANSRSGSDHPVFQSGGAGDCELDGILTPCSMVNRLTEALTYEARYWNSHSGFFYRQFDLGHDLPGRSSQAIWIPGELRDGEGRPGNVYQEGDTMPPLAPATQGGPNGQWLVFDPSSQTRNPNCILNAVNAAANQKKLGREINQMFEDPPTNSKPSPWNAHDGIHVVLDKGSYNVSALPAMSGRVLHYAPQGVSAPSSGLAVLDIQLNISVDGEPLVLSLKDQGYTPGAFRPGQSIKSGDSLGTVNGEGLNSANSTGLHVALMRLSDYRRYVQRGNVAPEVPIADVQTNGRSVRNRPYSSNARNAVPWNRLIDAGSGQSSPFRCP